MIDKDTKYMNKYIHYLLPCLPNQFCETVSNTVKEIKTPCIYCFSVLSSNKAFQESETCNLEIG